MAEQAQKAIPSSGTGSAITRSGKAYSPEYDTLTERIDAEINKACVAALTASSSEGSKLDARLKRLHELRAYSMLAISNEKLGNKLIRRAGSIKEAISKEMLRLA